MVVILSNEETTKKKYSEEFLTVLYHGTNMSSSFQKL